MISRGVLPAAPKKPFQNSSSRGWQGQEHSGWSCLLRSGPSRWSDPATLVKGFETASSHEIDSACPNFWWREIR